MSLRSWLLGRVFDRLRVTPDVVAHLTSLQRLGETVDLDVPTELVVVGARQAFRALRTRAAAQVASDWVWPFWIEAQLDPAGPAFVPRGHLPVLTNVTHRNWTAVGTLGCPHEAVVDPHGLVTPWFDGPSLDWWVRGPAGWQYPSRSAGVVQGLAGIAPVVRTAMPVGGGGVVTSTAYGVAGTPDVVAVRFENATDAPVALGLAVRPANPEGLAVVGEIAVDGGCVTVDGSPFLHIFGARPTEVRLSTLRGGDVVAGIERRAGPDVAGGERAVTDPAGLATGVLVFVLERRSPLTVALPLGRPRRRRRGVRRPRPRTPALPAVDPEAAVRGWEAQAGRGVRFRFPEERATAAVSAQAAYLLLMCDGDTVTPGPYTYHRFWFRDATHILRAMGHLGLAQDVARVLRSYPARQDRDGFFRSQPKEWDSNGAALTAVADHWRLTGDESLLSEVMPAVARGVRWIVRKIRTTEGAPADVAGLLPAGISAEHLGPFDVYYWDAFVSLRGLRDAVELCSAAGVPDVAQEAAEAARRLAAALDRSLSLLAGRLGGPAMAAGPRRGLDAGMIGSLAACYPLGLLAGDDPRVVATRDAIVSRFCDGPRYFHAISHTGFGTYLALHLAGALMAAGDPGAWGFADWLLDAASPTWTWPEAIHPRLRGGCMGDGHHLWAAAEMVSFLRNMCVREVPGGLALCSLVPGSWRGGDLRLDGVPTAHGPLDVRLTWEDGTAVLEWAGAWRGAPPSITAPGLDRDWESAEAAGRAVFPVSEREDGRQERGP